MKKTSKAKRQARRKATKRRSPSIGPSSPVEQDDYFRSRWKKAIRGDVQAAEDLVAGYLEYLDSDQEPPPILRVFIRVALKRVLDAIHESNHRTRDRLIAKAFYFDRPAERPKGTGNHDPYEIAAYVLLTERVMELEREDAKERVSDDLNINKRKIERALEAVEDEIAHLTIEELKSI